MKLSQMFFKTYRENPVDAEIKSHQLMVRAGYIKKQSAGIYLFLPLGIRVLNKLTNIIRQEMDKSGANEVLMSGLIPVDVYAGRLKHFGKDMFRLNDRTGKELCLGPSHEEVFTLTVKDAVTSYKQLPVMLYQIQTKYRDEVRPRFGLIRGKEFLMKDAYSFDKDKEGLAKSYNIMSDTYKRIFTRLGLDFVVVDADNGAMAGSASQEFMVKSEIGEDEIIVCHSCGYASNMEKAPCVNVVEKFEGEEKEKQLCETPDCKTIEELASYLNTTSENFCKAVVYKTDDGKIVVALVRGDKEIEEVKLIRALGVISVEMASIEDIEKIGSVAGFVGAFDLKNCIVVADESLKNMHNFVIGANKKDHHYINANLKDLKIDKFADIRKAEKGDICVKCGKELSTIRTIEVGHIFKQDTHYTELLDCTFLDENGKKRPMEMGAYGIGVTRTIAAMIEQFSDDKGIILPEEVAPYRCVIVTANQKDSIQVEKSQLIYNSLQSKNVEVLWDDRKDSLGVKLNDAELIGVPYIIIVGREAGNNKFELITRKGLIKTEVSFEDLMKKF